jgi:hypothetical protein
VVKVALRTLQAIALLALLSCGQSEDQARAPLTIADFERSAFLRRHPAKEHRVEPLKPAGSAWIYSFDDTETEGRILVQLEPAADRITVLTITWPGEASETTAAWNSVKKQFVADLLESTFPEIDYGKVSSYVMEQKPGAPAATSAGTIGEAKIQAGASGSNLVLELSR